MTGQLPHICFLAPNAYPILANDAGVDFAGGAELQQVLIARYLVALGYRVSMICLDFGQDELVEIDGIVVHRAFRPGAGVPVLRFLWPRLTSIWSCLKRVNADIYYQRAASMLTGVVAVFAKRNAKKSIFAVAGDPMIPFKRDQWLYEYGIKHVDRVVVQNAEQQRAVRDSVKRASILIPNIYQAGSHRKAPSGNNVLWVGTIRQIKRPDLYLDLAQALPEYRFTMVGGEDGMDSSLYEAIKARSETLDNVNFVGFVPYAEIGRYFDEAMLFVNTSDSEGFPNTFLQSWARGVPTISFIDSGARMNESPIGRIVDSIDAMIGTVAQLMKNHTDRSDLGKACRAHVETHHDPKRVIEMYEDLFRGMTRDNAAS